MNPFGTVLWVTRSYSWQKLKLIWVIYFTKSRLVLNFGVTLTGYWQIIICYYYLFLFIKYYCFVTEYSIKWAHCTSCPIVIDQSASMSDVVTITPCDTVTNIGWVNRLEILNYLLFAHFCPDVKLNPRPCHGHLDDSWMCFLATMLHFKWETKS